MAWQLTEDLDAYLATAGGFLRAHLAENTILLGAAETLLARGPAAFGTATPLFGCGPGRTARWTRRSCTRRRTRWC